MDSFATNYPEPLFLGPAHLKFDTPLDKSRGHAFLSDNGDLFYSPNSSRVVKVPPPFDFDRGNPFYPPSLPVANSNMHRRAHNYWDLDVTSYKTPNWWTDWYGWLSFLQMEDNEFNGAALFRCLKAPLTQYIEPDPDFPEELDDENAHAHDPLKFKMKEGYMLASCERDNWHRLDRQLYYACTELARVFRIPCFFPFHPWVMGYLRPHKRYGAFTLCLDKSREWFRVLLALLSYLIAGSQTREQMKQEEFPVRIPLPGLEGKSFHWKDVLLSGGQGFGVDQWWMDFLLETTVLFYKGEVDRVGVFLHLESQPRPFHAWEPDPTFLCAHGVPVWYPWTTKQSKQNWLAKLAPLPHQIQTATTFLCKSPSRFVAQPDAQDCVEGLGQSLGAVPDYEPVVSRKKMDEFFQLRNERNKRLEATESDRDRQRRLNRERQKPTTSAPMFLWIPNDHGEYESKPVPRCEKETYFEIYEERQMWYDSFRNEWHVCELWGPDKIDEDFEAFYLGDLREESELPAPPDIEHDAVLDGDDWQNVNVYEGNRSVYNRADAFEGEILHVLSQYFGYTAEIPLPNRPIVQDEARRKRLCRWLGIEWNMVQSVETQKAFERPAVAAALDFLERLARTDQSNARISTDEWDLFSQNRHSVANTPRFKQFRQVTSNDGVKLFMLDLKEKKQAVWYLALKHAADVAVICRLGDLTEFNIVEFLLQNGIPFHTLVPSNLVSRTPIASRPSLVPPFRPKDYQFGVTDYLSYRERCVSILQHPRGRAALMHGGLMWRLAVNVVAWENAYSGPSGWSPIPEEMIIVSDSVTNLELLDDRLSDIEQQALCGTYLCHTGQTNSTQTSTSSWYMPPQLFPRSTQDMGRWTGYSDKVFRMVDRVYFSDPSLEFTHKPRTRTQWKNQGDGGNRRALLRVDKKVLDLLSS